LLQPLLSLGGPGTDLLRHDLEKLGEGGREGRREGRRESEVLVKRWQGSEKEKIVGR
jgi:hypothetical protein